MPRRSLLPACVLLLALCNGAWSQQAVPAEPVETTALVDAIRQALAHDPEVRQARSQVDAARAQQRQARSRWFPNVGLSAVGGRADVIDLGQDFERRTGRTEAYARLNLFNGGADLALSRASGHEHQASQLELARVLNDAAERTAQTYFEALRQQTLARNAGERLADVQKLAADVDRLVNSGKSPESDRHAAQASVADAQIALHSAQLDANLARRRLTLLMGAQPGALIEPALPEVPVQQALDDLPGVASGSNPGWLASRERALSARTRLGIVQPELLPRVDVEWRRVLKDTTFPVSSSSTQKSWSVNLAYDMPLGGATFARRDEGLAQAAAADGEADRIAQQVELDVNDALTDLHRAQQARPIYQRQVRHLEAVVAASTLQYTAGRRDLIDLIAVRDAPFVVRQKLADTAQRQQAASVRYWARSGRLLPVLGLSDLIP